MQYPEDSSDLQAMSYYCKLMTTVFESWEIQLNGGVLIKIITFNENTEEHFCLQRFFFTAEESKRPVKHFNYNAADAASMFLVLFVHIVMCWDQNIMC